jgi:hypothetical protein
VSTKTTATVQVPLVGILGIVFITLKLLGKITWSWLWVLAPFWAPLALAVLIGLVLLLIGVLL